jgi:uncharacterized repeat protein (TIGR03803 family)
VPLIMKKSLIRLGFLLCVTMLPTFPGQALSTLHSFANKSDGAQPYAGLAQGSDGNFYGTCFIGGSNGFGSVFKITPGGAFTLLHSFSFSDGETPTAALLQGADGNFYGTTFEGGSNFDNGTVFQISSNGAFNSLYSFTNGLDGANPYAGLCQGPNGAFYGTTVNGGSNHNGSVFAISSAGALTPLYSFTNGADGSHPYTSLTLASDGLFYGTTYSGGANNDGVIFQITSAGALTPLHSFNGAADGANPLGQLVEATPGILYGTTYAGGASGFGTVYSMTAGGAFNVLYAFTNGIDGANPAAGLALGSDGNLYGTTYSGGPSGNGGIFQLTLLGALTPLYLFSGGNDGAFSYGTLVQGSDGDFYGTTQYGGTHNDGLVFKLNALSFAPVITGITLSSGSVNINWTGLPGRTFQAQYAVSLTQSTWISLGAPVTATNGFACQTDPAPSPAQRFYRVYLVP